MEWLAAAFIITGMWVWFWAAVCFVLVMTFSENENNLFAFITVGAFAALMHHSGIISLFANPLAILGWAAVYFAAGGVWSFIKWFSYVTKRADKYGEVKLTYIGMLNKNFDSDQQLAVDVKTTIPKEMIEGFNKYLANHYYESSERYSHDEKNLDSIIPSAMGNKERIVTWILWWPTSAFWTILNDPLVRFANWMYSRFQGMYKRIAFRAFAKFEV